MKIEIEITNDQLIYSWSFKEGGRQQGSMGLHPNHYILFSEVLRMIQADKINVQQNDFDKLLRKVGSQEYISNNIEEVKATIKKMESKNETP